MIQVLWKWLTFGNNATAIASITSVVGLAGLYLYVLYTRDILRATLATLQSSEYPVLIAQIQDISNENLKWKIHNIGNGPAQNVFVWRIEEGNDAQKLFKKRQLLPRDEFATIYGTLRAQHDDSAAFEVRYPVALKDDCFLVLIDAFDVNGKMHQLQILSWGRDDETHQLSWECFNVPPAKRRALFQRRRKSGFVHGKGAHQGFDFNLMNIDGTPRRAPKRRT